MTKNKKAIKNLLSLMTIIYLTSGCLTQKAPDPIEEQSNSSEGEASAVRSKDKATKNKNATASDGDLCIKEKGRKIYRLVDGSVSWQAIKLETLPVVGKIAVDGEISVDSKEATLEDASAQLDFNPKSLDSADELRDTRIQDIVLLAGEESLSFKMDEIELGEETKMPAIGNSIPGSITGDLSIAGVDLPLSIPVMVTAIENGIKMNNTSEGFQINLNDGSVIWGLVGDLLDVANVESMEENVAIFFDVEFKDYCAK